MARKRIRSNATSADPVADPVTAYALDVAEGHIIAGPHVRDACARHLRDLERLPPFGYRWHIPAVEHVLGFFRDVLRLNGGEHEGKPFVVQPWQAFVLGSLFGWQQPHSDDGKWVRRFKTVFIETGKGSGKSPLAAGVGLYGLMADGEARAEVYAAAAKKDQAMVLFRDAVAMVRQSPALASRLQFSGGTGREYNIAYLATGSFFRPLASDSDGAGQSGPRPHINLLDEIHEHRTNAMVEFLRSGKKGRRQALDFMITNSGFDRSSVCYEYHEYGTKVSAAEIEDESFFSYICAVDEGDDPLDPEKGRDCWAKANPSMGVTFPISYLEEQVASARGMPAKESIVRRLNFCQWVEAANPWIDADLWRACEDDRHPKGALDLEALGDRPCFVALDLSSKRDLTSMAAVWPDEDGGMDAAVWFWTPADTLVERERKDRVPYSTWVRKGFLEAVTGRSIDYGFPASKLAELATTFNLSGLAFDQWRIEDFLRALDTLGLDGWLWDGPDAKEMPGLRLVRHGQGYGGGNSHSVLWLPRSIGELEDRVTSGRLRVKKNPVLTWNSASAVLEADAAGNKKWEKRKSTGRIDGIVALSMAVGLAAAMPEKKVSVYESRGVLVF